MAALLQVQVQDPADRQPVAGVTLEAGPPPADAEPQAGDLDPHATLAAPVRDLGPGAFEVDVPDGGKLVVRLRRTGFAPLQVSLDLRAAPGRFRHGTPRAMRLASAGASKQGTQTVRRFALVVDWPAAAQELVMASGHDTMFHPAAPRRHAWLFKEQRVHATSVLTRFRFDTPKVKKGAPPVFELRRDTLLLGVGQFTPALMTTEVVQADHDKTALTVYEYLAAVGRERPGSVLELGLLNHAYWIGPVVLGTTRNGYDCHDRCPVHGGHHKHTFSFVPKAFLEHQRWLGDPKPGDQPTVGVAVMMRELSVEAGGERWTNWRAGDPGHRRTFVHSPARGEQGEVLDRDFRNTDFCHPGMLEKQTPSGLVAISLESMRAALHADAELRVWGCSNGALGGLWRAAFQQAEAQAKAGKSSPNRKIDVEHFHTHDDKTTFHTWEVRQRDFELMYLSNLRRSYPQALAVALERPCFGAVPGTWAWFEDRDREGGLTIHTGVHTVISPLARRLGIGEPSPARYYRFDPAYMRTQKLKVRLNVLMTGFVPFRVPERPEFPATNGSAEAVKRVNAFNIEWGSRVPPWIDFELNLVKQPAVDVVFTCPAARTQHPPAREASNRPAFAVKGSEGILRAAQEVDADIVIIVGESGGMAQRQGGKPQHIRVESFARNFGDGFDPARPMVDNDGFALDAEGEIFPGEPPVLRTTVPLRAYALAQSALKNVVFLEPEEFRTRDPIPSAGGFVCNESHYRLLLEAQRSGRWVSMIHVPATEFWDGSGRAQWKVEDPGDRLRDDVAHALETALQAFVEHMLWGDDVYGRLDDDEARARKKARRAGRVQA